jgi:hypothetical protein
MHCIAGVLCQEMTPRFNSRVLHMHCAVGRWLHLPLSQETLLNYIILLVYPSTVTTAALHHATVSLLLLVLLATHPSLLFVMLVHMVPFMS